MGEDQDKQIQELLEHCALDMKSIKSIKDWEKHWQVVDFTNAKRIIKQLIEAARLEEQTNLIKAANDALETDPSMSLSMFISIYYGD